MSSAHSYRTTVFRVESSLIQGKYCSWAAKAETGKFFPAEILGMIRVYVSLENDEDDFSDYDTDSNVYYAGRGSFTGDVDDIYGSY